MNADRIYVNGIDVDTGTYAIPPLSVQDLHALLRGEKVPDNIRELEVRAARPEVLGVKEGVDEKDLCQTGWGIILADDAGPEVEAALQPLLELRQEQAGKRFHRYGFRVGKDSKDSFLSRHGAAPGPADPDRVPYYLLIAGSPETIPYRFQSQLDVQYAVGRLHFDTLAEYRTYAESVVCAETGGVKLPRRASFWGVSHPGGEPATDQSRRHLVEPLLQALGGTEGWSFDTVLGIEAGKEALRQRLGGAQTPALLFTASHGLRVPAGSQSGLAPGAYQGALVSADWPGPGHPTDPVAHLFAGADLARDANLLGLIAFFFACFSAGTPHLDAFGRLQRLQLGQQAGPGLELAPQPFVAGLPKRMLSAPRGGALAAVGHVERTWPSSFVWKRQEDGTLPAQIAAVESTMRRLLAGYPVGAAVEYLNSRYADLATTLHTCLEAIQFGDPYDAVEFVNVWMAAVDAEWFTIVGDPAVRLPVVDAGEAQPRPVLVSTADVPPAREDLAAPPTPSQPGEREETAAPTDADPRFARSYTVAPAPTRELAELRCQHPELYQAYVQHVKDGYENNGRVFDDVRRAFMRSHNSTVVMYWILFAIGVSTVAAGIVLALGYNQALAGAAFAGLGVASFIGYFISRSTQSLEENLLYITWLGVIYNTYWTHLAWATQRDTAQAELDRATADALRQLEQLVDRHAMSARTRPTPRGSETRQAGMAQAPAGPSEPGS